MAGFKGTLLTILVGLMLAGLIGAEYYRSDLSRQADVKDRTARQVVQQVVDLKTREQRLQPDLPLMEQLEETMLDPKNGNLHQQILAHVLFNQEESGLKLKDAQVGQRNLLGGAEGHGASVQFEGSLAGLIEYMRYLEAGPVAARITGLRLNLDEKGLQGSSATKPGATQGPPFQLNTQYYSRSG